MSVKAERNLQEYLRGKAHNFVFDFHFVNDLKIHASPKPPPRFLLLASPEPALSESLGSLKPLTLSKTLAYLMAVAQSIFVPKTICHPAHIGHAQSLT